MTSGGLDEPRGRLRTDQRIVENLSKHVDVRALRVLEVGAGTGRDAADLAAMGARVVAIDYSEESLRLMRSTLSEAEGIVCGDATRLPFVAGVLTWFTIRDCSNISGGRGRARRKRSRAQVGRYPPRRLSRRGTIITRSSST